ncbi:hypothetical protein CKY04_00285 [Photorhabdus sp. S8-52]|nr:hypothetical protein CKY03_00285 [Photorhabdus sp. S9-53]RAX04570.1 hypothetical protein CKY05_00285 [Photorhabdus sp. S10-54]RAX06188.1 hypothetical protein CKY04_00285 [Photorhabdus sp. S8-52]
MPFRHKGIHIISVYFICHNGILFIWTKNADEIVTINTTECKETHLVTRTSTEIQEIIQQFS